MVSYKTLKTTHKDYDDNVSQIIKNDLLYRAGSMLSRHAELFLGRGEDESDDFYEERLNTACDPIFANVIERFKSLLFSTPLEIKPTADTNNSQTPSDPISTELSQFLKDFQKNCDGRGTSLHNFVKKSFLTALKHDYALTMVDLPNIEEQQRGKSREEQQSLKQLNGYLIDIPLLSCINWQKDDNGDFEWVTLFTERNHQDNPLADHMCLYRWILICLEPTSETDAELRVVFHIYEKDINLDNDEKITDDDDIPEVKIINTTFPIINVVELCLGEGLAFGNLIAPACEQLFRTDSIINAAAQRNVIFSLPVLMAGDNLPATGHDGRRAINVVQANPNRFEAGPTVAQKYKGWMLIGNQDKAMMLETEGKGMAVLQEQKKVIIERINASVHQVAQNIQSRGNAQAQSAAAKQEDMRDTEIILSEFKLATEHYVLKLIRLLLILRKEPLVELQVGGLNIEDEVDRKEVLAELQVYGRFPDAPIFQVNYEYNNALALIGDELSEDDKIELRKQTEESVRKRANQPMDENGNPMGVSNAKPTNKATAEDKPKIGPSGQPMMDEGAHLQSGEHIDAQTVYDQLSKDYKEKDIEWVLAMAWVGPKEVPLSSIDFSNKDNWAASEEEDKVDDFADKIANQGFTKPIILVNNRSNDNKMIIVDGHHRALAYQQNNQPAMAYIGESSADSGPWDKLHSKQIEGKQASLSSNQKEDSNEAQ